MHTAFLLRWTEYDEGIQRSDGMSIHLSKDEALEYQKKMSTGSHGLYWRADGPKEIFISNKIHEKIIKSGHKCFRIDPQGEKKYVNVLTEATEKA